MQFLKDEIETLRHRSLLRKMRMIRGAQGPDVLMDGKRVVLLCSNNYLGLAGDPRLTDAALRAMEKYGLGAGGSRLISGNMEAHEELEDRIARFKKTEAALVFGSGWHANVGTISAVVDRNDLVLSDELNHASIVDGCRLSRAETVVFPHKDLDALSRALKTSRHRRRLVVTDGVFSMDGDVAPLPEIADLCEKYGAILMVDEAHATGVFGEHGGGIIEHFGLEGRVDIIMGTLGKALGCYGAYIAGTHDLIEFLQNKARTFIFSTSLPPSLCAAARKAFDIIEEEGWRREALWTNIRVFSEELKNVPVSGMTYETQIFPLLIGDERTTMALCGELFDQGIFCQGIRPPTVPAGTSRLRLTLMATHTQEHLSKTMAALKKIFLELFPSPDPSLMGARGEGEGL